MAKACRSMLNPGSALLTFPTLALSALSRITTLWVWQNVSGSERALYGERDGSGRCAFNAISAGPIRTLAASGIKDFAKCWLIAKPLPRFAVPLLLKCG